MAAARAATLRRPVLVALVVLALAVTAAVAVFGVGRHGGAPATADGPDGYHRTGPSSVAYVLTDSRRPRVLTVYGETDDACPGAPRPTVRGVVAAQTPSVVSVRLDRWSSGASAGACAGVGVGPQPTTLTLAADLGPRLVRELRSGRVLPTLDLATVAEPHQLPTGYVTQPWQWQPGADGAFGTLTRTYVHGDDLGLRYVVWARAPYWIDHGNTVIARTDVGGRAARVQRESGEGPPALVWTLADGRAAMVQGGSATVADLLLVARSVR